MLENPAPEGRTSLAQRWDPQRARFWRDGVEGFSAGKSGYGDSNKQIVIGIRQRGGDLRKKWNAGKVPVLVSEFKFHPGC